MKCKLCGYNMTLQNTSFCACDAQPPVRFDNVPAHVCDMCGEKAFSQETVEKIQSMRKGRGQSRIVSMKVYDYSNPFLSNETQRLGYDHIAVSNSYTDSHTYTGGTADVRTVVLGRSL